MARTFTLALLKTAVRQRADIETDPHKGDTELETWISSSYTWLYDLLVQSGLAYAKSTQTITTDGNSAYALSADFYAPIRVWYQVSADKWWPLREAHPREQYRLITPGASRAVAYEIAGSNIELFPTPPSGQTYVLRYIPAPANLTEDAQTVDGISGWEELIVVDAAIKALYKEEANETIASLKEERAVLVNRIEKMALNRQLASAMSLFREDEQYEADPASWRFGR